jgi:energy-coupling factor transport system ATP-binding protein
MDILFEQVSHVYQQNTPFEFKALDHVSFHIPSGSFIAIVGHTGSGKSTLIQHLNGLLKPTSGRIRIGDYTITPDAKLKDIMKIREKVGIVFQYPEHQLFEETVEKDILFGPKNFHIPEETIKKRLPEVLAAVQLPESILTRSPFDLSGGQMRRVAIAGVLIMDPEVLILDEPTAGLDPRGQQEIMNMFYRLHKEKNQTTILVTHSMEHALEYADYCLIMDHGQIYMEGNPMEVFQQEEALHRVHLDIPEVMQFINQFNKVFPTSIKYSGQTIQELAQMIAKGLRSVGEK